MSNYVIECFADKILKSIKNRLRFSTAMQLVFIVRLDWRGKEGTDKITPSISEEATITAEKYEQLQLVLKAWMTFVGIETGGYRIWSLTSTWRMVTVQVSSVPTPVCFIQWFNYNETSTAVIWSDVHLSVSLAKSEHSHLNGRIDNLVMECDNDIYLIENYLEKSIFIRFII